MLTSVAMTKPTIRSVIMNRSLRREMANKRRRKDEAWLDDQDALNAVADKIANEDPSAPKNIKVIESLNRPVNCTRLFGVLCGKKNVHSLSLVGVHFDERAAIQLSETLRHPQTEIKVLQVWRFLPSCLPSLCDAITENKELREIRLTFHGDLNHEQTSMLLGALKANQGLVAIKLFGVNLSRHEEELESLVRSRQKTTDLHLTRCQIKSISGLAQAIAKSKTLQKLDLSMNDLSSDADIALMLQSKSLKSLILSKNQIGKESGSMVMHVLASNEILEELFLEGNPLSVAFASSLLESLQRNTTLRRLGFMKSYMGNSMPSQLETDIRNLVALNEAGRGWLRAASAPSTTLPELACLSHLLHRTRAEPSALFGVLREHTNLWVKP